jgi:hypothetical protein
VRVAASHRRRPAAFVSAVPIASRMSSGLAGLRMIAVMPSRLAFFSAA